MLKKIYFIFLFIIIGSYSFADINYDANILIDSSNDVISGEIIIATDSNSNQDIELKIIGFYDIFLDDKPILTKAGFINISISQDKEVKVTFKRSISDNDTFTKNFYSFSNLVPIVLTEEVSINYKLKLLLPKNFEAITEAEEIIKSIKKDNVSYTFKINKPIQNFDLIASSNYNISSKKIGNTTIYSYFFRKNNKFSDKYLNLSEKYIKEYEKKFNTKFPYKRFSIVEHPHPYGYASPTYTVLSSKIIHLPFIPYISLPHEILHQWFGSSIQLKDNRNFFEAITSYLADHEYYTIIKDDSNYRKNILIDYESYVSNNQTYPLSNFIYNDSKISQSIGYGKGAMVFHMIKSNIGTDNFNKSIVNFINHYNFKLASWDDIFNEFENVSGEDFSKFKNYWLNNVAIPDIKVFNGRLINSRGNYSIQFTLERVHGPDKMLIPFTLHYSNDEKKKFFIESVIGKKEFSIPVIYPEVALILDEDYDIMRKLDYNEIPPTLSKIFSSKKLIGISSDTSQCSNIFERLNIDNIKDYSDITFNDLETHNLVICGYNNRLLKNIHGSKFNDNKEDLSIYEVIKSPYGNNKYILIADNPDQSNVSSIFHYGKYSKVIFNKEKIINKSVNKSSNGIEVYSFKSSKGRLTSSIMNIDDVVKEAKNYPVIFIGEKHDSYGNHLNQLEIIRKLNEDEVKIAVAFELIQKQFQKVADDFSNGKIDEEKFLKKIEYFTRWGYDYSLYAPIIRYVQSKKIPIIALNIDNSINRKVSKGQYDNLTSKELEQLPKEMNLLNDDYDKVLREIFYMHLANIDTTRTFNNFKLSQNIWDEVMAESIVRFQKKNPDTKVIVIAGSGHVGKNTGIPLRYKRLTGKTPFVIMQDDEYSKEEADLVLSSPEIEGINSPKLGIVLIEKDEYLQIDTVVKNSLAEKSGMINGDILLSCEGSDLVNLNDLKYLLFKKGDNTNLTCIVKRKEKNITLDIYLK